MLLPGSAPLHFLAKIQWATLRRCASTLLPVLFLLAGSFATAIAQSLEFRVKAAFLLNFTKFIEWPSDALPSQSPDQSVDLCILGDDPFGTAIDQIVAGETLQGRKLRVQRVHVPVPESCRVVYFSREENNIGATLEGLGQGVLTVGEGDAFLREGGMIAFVLENNRVRFDINYGAAMRARLMLSSRLLTVARTVER